MRHLKEPHLPPHDFVVVINQILATVHVLSPGSRKLRTEHVVKRLLWRGTGNPPILITAPPPRVTTRACYALSKTDLPPSSRTNHHIRARRIEGVEPK
tara:strand:+ start:1584 stop:1877 length:294 start_codon:yes stop_codon:yes gene_type:complete